jgi:uncharacterized membrane protein YkoI
LLTISAQAQLPLTASVIIEQLERRLGGKVIALETSADGKRYRVQLLTAKAEVKVLDIDAHSGKRLGLNSKRQDTIPRHDT